MMQNEGRRNRTNINSIPPILVLVEVFDMSLSTTNQKENVAKNSVKKHLQPTMTEQNKE